MTGCWRWSVYLRTRRSGVQNQQQIGLDLKCGLSSSRVQDLCNVNRDNERTARNAVVPSHIWNIYTVRHWFIPLAQKHENTEELYND